MKCNKLTIKNPQSIYHGKLTRWAQTEQCSFEQTDVIVNEFWWAEIVCNKKETIISFDVFLNVCKSKQIFFQFVWNLNLLSFSSVGWFYTASSAGLDNLTLYGPANAAIYYKKYTIQNYLILKSVSRLFLYQL